MIHLDLSYPGWVTWLNLSSLDLFSTNYWTRFSMRLSWDRYRYRLGIGGSSLEIVSVSKILMRPIQDQGLVFIGLTTYNICRYCISKWLPTYSICGYCICNCLTTYNICLKLIVYVSLFLPQTILTSLFPFLPLCLITGHFKMSIKNCQLVLLSQSLDEQWSGLLSSFSIDWNISCFSFSTATSNITVTHVF
jgi:hypothetical protein